MNFYKKISQRIEDLILAVVALGILVVSIEYIQFFLDHKNNINYSAFIQRVFLFIIVVIFTSYYFIAYTAYFNTKHIEDNFKPFSPRKTIALYLNDLIQITIASWLYAALLIGNLTSAPDNVPEMPIIVTTSLLQTIFTIMFLWHLVVLTWYLMSSGSKRDKLIHTIYSFIYLVIVIIINSMNIEKSNEYIYVWYLLAFYFSVVISLYYFKGIYDMEEAIASHR